VKTGHDLERGENGGSTEAEPEFTGSLLDPRSHGWQWYSNLGGLFTLYVRGNETRAELSLELQEVANRIHRNRPGENEDYECEAFERMMFHAAIFAQAHREGGDCQSPGFASLREGIARDAVDALGSLALEILTAPTREKGDAAICRLAAFATRAGRGMLAMKFPNRAKSSGRKIPKELSMIEAARALCATLRRLPTKREVCELLTAIGIGFSPKSKNAEALWDRLFERSGLICLPS
jgi:hypothetical protein